MNKALPIDGAEFDFANKGAIYNQFRDRLQEAANKGVFDFTKNPTEANRFGLPEPYYSNLKNISLVTYDRYIEAVQNEVIKFFKDLSSKIIKKNDLPVKLQGRFDYFKEKIIDGLGSTINKASVFFIYISDMIPKFTDNTVSFRNSLKKSF